MLTTLLRIATHNWKTTALKVEHRLRVFENRKMRLKKLHSEELYD
jgi:hypothetical protein